MVNAKLTNSTSLIKKDSLTKKDSLIEKNSFMDRAILHSDLNGFYASVECFLEPKIRELPVVVGGDVELRHGIVLAKNDHAKKFGIITGEAIWQAKQKCPNLVSVKPNYENYHKFSKKAREIYSRYTDKIEAFGIDECWLDVTGSQKIFGDGVKIADEIRNTILAETGITASIGVSFNKVYAKFASDMRKPNYTNVIKRENFCDIVWRFPVGELIYVGKATARKLNDIGIRTIGDLANANIQSLHRVLGKWGIVLYRMANGEDHSEVAASSDSPGIKSVGNSTTLPRDIKKLEDVKGVIYMLAESVAARLRESGMMAKTVQVYFRDNKLVSSDRQGKLAYPSYLSGEIAEKAIEIYCGKYFVQNPIRTLGVRATDLVPEKIMYQMDIFTNFDKREKLGNLEGSLDEIRKRYGYKVIQKGIIYLDTKLTGINVKDDHTIHPVNFFDGPLPI